VTPSIVTSTKDLPQVQESLRLLQLNWHLLPIYGVKPDGTCTCGRNPCPGRAGKHPILNNGWKDASNKIRDVWDWFHKWPTANLAISLEQSSLVVVGPDSQEWLDTFREDYGLPSTAVAQSGGGNGHVHFYFRRPPDCPKIRINKSGQYDIQSSGYMILPPSRHASGNSYEWLIHPLDLTELPFVPGWAINLLGNVTNPQKQHQVSVKSLTGDDPPVPLDADGMLLWSGAEYIGTEKFIDRSETLFAIGATLADAGATHEEIMAALANRDQTLKYNKYLNRPYEYQRIAINLLGPPP
jgi:Bifunctional DNA primase/polymerase, N-terminal